MERSRKQVGDNIMWLGMSSNEGKFWTNAFAGKINGDIIRGTWQMCQEEKLEARVINSRSVAVGWSSYYLQDSSTGSPFGTFNWEKVSCLKIVQSFGGCGWNKSLPTERSPSGGPPLQPPPNLR